MGCRGHLGGYFSYIWSFNILGTYKVKCLGFIKYFRDLFTNYNIIPYKINNINVKKILLAIFFR